MDGRCRKRQRTAGEKGLGESSNEAGGKTHHEWHHRAPLEANAAVPISDDLIAVISCRDLLGPPGFGEVGDLMRTID